MDTTRRVMTSGVREFVFAGNSFFTLQSMKTGNTLTYKVRHQPADKSRFGQECWFVRVRVRGKMEYLGYMKADSQLRLTRRSIFKFNSTEALAFDWFMRKIDRIPDSLVFWHEGSCGRCGRRLTDIQSVERGFGPECWKYVNLKPHERLE